jgi:hypothetical protein
MQRNSPLMVACKGGHVSVVMELVKVGLMSIYRIEGGIHH